MLLAQLDQASKPPQALNDALPPGLQGQAGILWYVVVGLVALVVLLVLYRIVRRLFAGKKPDTTGAPNLQEKLGDYPPLKANSGDRRLMCDGVPVRLRLVIVAPAGTGAEVNEDDVDHLLDRVVTGLGEIAKQDRPRVRIWPAQISNEGFAHKFHTSTVIPEKEGELSPWACIAGRAKLGKTQLMLGLAVQGLKPNTLGRRTIEPHEWGSVLRVRVRSEA